MPLFEQEKQSLPSNLLAERYGVPPFSILNTITQNWQRRKDRWEYLGFNSVEGRNVKRNNALPVNTFSARGADAKDAERTSTFDPVLCELMIKWFSNSGDTILDPFAGGSVRGIVANALGRYYTGIDLSETQVKENYKQLDYVLDHYTGFTGLTEWLQGDSAKVLEDAYVLNKEFDMLFTCPPYYNLEKYSNNVDDLSNAVSYQDFIVKFRQIISSACERLKNGTFAVIIVSEIRNTETGEYYGFVPDTISAFTSAGLHYYDEIILENNIGSLPIRGPKYFDQSRKIGKHHQNVLVFWKGDTKKISEKFGAF